MTDKIYVVVDKRSGEFIYFHPRTEDAETSPGYGEFYADPEEIYLDVIIDSWPRNKPAPTLGDLEIVEYVRDVRVEKVTWAERRERLGLSIEDVADELGFYPEFVRDVEQGKEKLLPEEVQDWLAIYFPQPGQDKPEQMEVEG